MIIISVLTMAVIVLCLLIISLNYRIRKLENLINSKDRHEQDEIKLFYGR